jgi:hypothetical protein
MFYRSEQINAAIPYPPFARSWNRRSEITLTVSVIHQRGFSISEGIRNMETHKIWIQQCDSARNLEEEFGTQHALEYLIGEKFLNFLEAAETNAGFRAEIPAFTAEIKKIFERWQLANYLETARETEPFDPSLFEPKNYYLLGKEEIEFDAEEIEEMRKDDIQRCTRDLLLLERAREWLLEEDG